MPLYEYVCKDCGHHFDALRSMKDADKTINCRSCQSEQTTSGTIGLLRLQCRPLDNIQQFRLWRMQRWKLLFVRA
jgi:putative FmdB family regulatory protein